MCPASVPQLAVRVPCSTSNLGPGFDFLGLALSLYLKVNVVGAANGDKHEFASRSGEAATWPFDASENLLCRAFDLALQAGEAEPRAVRFAVRSEIPLGRGFGSSGAAVAAGLLLGTLIAGKSGGAQETLRIGCELEGHPDNSTASLLAGCTLAVPHSGGLRVVKQEVHPSIGFSLAWPHLALTTAAARAVLPSEVPFADAVENPRRLALLLEGLRTGSAELLALGAEERLHESFRLPLIPGGAAAIAAAREAGAWAAMISGSGSGLVALSPLSARADVADAMRAALDTDDGPAHAQAVDFVSQAPIARRL